MNRLQHAWTTLRSSLWFVPSLVVLGCVLLAIALIELDTLAPSTLQRFPRVFGAGAEGSRGMLSAIASATITVAGVVFSVTIVALSLTASQYTSRVLRNFMADRTNQVVLGVFVGIHAYCLIVLRTIRGGDEQLFVPSLATLGGIVLAFVGMGLLIHFIHHITSSIQASRILAAIHEETTRSIERLFPERLGEGPDAADESAEPLGDSRFIACRAIVAKRTGYIQNIAPEALLRLACELDAVVRVPHPIGHFVIAGTALVEVDRPASDGSLEDEVRQAIAIGERRTIEQDVGFGIRQIVDIALKALSPAINDPTTATMCVDYLSAVLVALARRRFPSPCRYADGKLRVITSTPTFAALVQEAFEELRLASSGQPVVIRCLVRALSAVADATTTEVRRGVVLQRVSQLLPSVSLLADDVWRVDLTKLITEVGQRRGNEHRK